ncbi:hypothetical protein H9Y04_22055 [Streptomyces sp. TRM66268-LWL]|uniref:Secreted protein n=1 Tax=Streptomyces polyasparticus TaxID=2767826 RepID=A0ABR7SKK3_9ACTN|nr:hypothetical protein [Streptomyces polyasparticus]MBC9715240.1 hypothetical protein [Streptomyces polyasparticus]
MTTISAVSRRSLAARAAAVLLLAAGTIVPTAGSAAADSDACTHHWSGPQVCIELRGLERDVSVTAVWTNPPSGMRKRTVYLYHDGDRYKRAVATRRNGELRYTWPREDRDLDTKICVRFEGSQRMACEYTRYLGNRKYIGRN